MKFSTKITRWYQNNKRDLPWRKTTDPYKIWLSEIILQQTRIDQGTSYYHKFTENFPSVEVLARASEDQVLKLWQGLGYYTRARNLHKTAKIIVNKYDGVFPKTYMEIISLPGIGEYTASAIVSIAYGQKYPVVDGNVYRFLSRFLGIETPIDSQKGKKEFNKIACELLSNANPGEYNQGVMEFGALFCKPANPDCSSCIFRKDCVAFRTGQVNFFPIKKTRPPQRIRYFYYFIFHFRGNDFSKILINKRGDNDIWAGLYDFPLIESNKPLSIHEIQKAGYGGHSLINCNIKLMGNQYKHILSHQVILASFIRIVIQNKKFADLQKNIQNEKLIPIDTRDLIHCPVPRLIEKFLKEYRIDESLDE